MSQMRGYPSLIAYGDLERVQCPPLILETRTAEATRAGVSVREPAGGFLRLLLLERGVLLLETIVRQRRERACLSCGPLVTKGVPRGCSLRVCRLGRDPAWQEVVSGGKEGGNARSSLSLCFPHPQPGGAQRLREMAPEGYLQCYDH